jgi:hypothetical protein
MHARVLAAVLAALVLAGCAGARVAPAGAGRVATAPAFSFEVDTFAFPNDIRSRNPDKPDLYANYCFVLARAIRQFHGGARFDPAAPRLAADDYVERVRAVAARPPWLDPLPPAERVVIPGYANLREFSRAEERSVKAGLGGRFWTWVHWTNWRVTFPVTPSHQEGVARRVVDELSAGRLVQLLVTNWPKPELNHTVVVYAARESEAGVELSVWDPNDPSAPGVMTFERDGRRFFATRLYDTERGPIRAFRMYHSWFL